MNDRQITIHYANSRKEVNWTEWRGNFSDFVKSASFVNPSRGKETIAEYMKLTKAQQDNIKDVGGVVFASFKNGNRRKAENIAGKDVIVLDYDSITPENLEKLKAVIAVVRGWAGCIHTTRKHTAKKPRARVMLLIDRTVTPDEYDAIARMTAEKIGMSGIDPTTFEAQRLFYYPSLCSDSEYFYKVYEGEAVSADSILAEYEAQGKNWKEWTDRPKALGEEKTRQSGTKQADPESKTGIVGAYIKYRSNDVRNAMQDIPGVYVPTNDDNRYSYSLGTTSGGAVIYDNGAFLYDHHSTSPCSGREVNCFDMVRIHKFGYMDADTIPNTPSNRLPSYKAMCDFAETIPEVQRILAEERREQARQDFAGLTANGEPSDIEKIDKLQSFYGQPISLEAVRAAMDANGYKIQRNVIVGNTTVSGLPRKYSKGNALNTLPIILKDILKAVKVKGANDTAICGYLAVLADENRDNPVADMMASTVWDNTDRLEDLRGIIGTISDFEWMLVKKWLIQCVAMAMNSEEHPNNAEGVLTLQGPEGIGKTLLFRKLSVTAEWFTEGVTLDMQNKDSLLRSINCWICELGELDSTSKKDQAALKGHLTAATDKIREPYAKAVIDRARRTSFGATVNPNEFLTGNTGNRRFWVIQVQDIKLKALQELSPEWMRQLWAQVYGIWRINPEGFRLSRDELRQLTKRNEQYQMPLPGEEEVRAALNWDLPVEEWQYLRASRVMAVIGIFHNVTPKQIGLVLAKLQGEYPQIDKRKGRSNVTEYLLPLKVYDTQL